MKYKDWLYDWLDNYIKPTSKTKTCARYTEIVERHIIPHLGDVELDELTPLVIQRYVTHLSTNGNLKTGKELAPNSVNAIITKADNSSVAGGKEKQPLDIRHIEWRKTYCNQILSAEL